MARFAVKTKQNPNNDIVEVWWKDDQTNETGHDVLSTTVFKEQYGRDHYSILAESNDSGDEDPDHISAVHQEFLNRDPAQASAFYISPTLTLQEQEDPPPPDDDDGDDPYVQQK